MSILKVASVRRRSWASFSTMWKSTLELVNHLDEYPITQSCLCNSFEDWIPVDKIYECSIFKWVAVTVSVWHDFKIEHKDISHHNCHQGNMLHWNSFIDLKISLNWNRTPVICFNELVLLLNEQLVYTSPEINAECLGSVGGPVSI